MQIKILDSWLRDYLKTDAKPHEIAKALSLSSVSVERLDKYDDDYLYDIEITTNRVDLMSVMGLAKEAAAVLSESGHLASFKHPDLTITSDKKDFPIEIKDDPKLVYRVCAVVMEVNVKKSPAKISKRLEASGIRSLNNIIDVTNYVMREVGHPAHVFDFDKLGSSKLIIRESKRGEKILTLDNKEYSLLGGDIVMEDDEGRIVDLLGIMGLSNSVVSESTKKVLFFIDNNVPSYIRKTSMNLGIRTEAAVLNEKGIDPDLAMDALRRGIKLYEELADGKTVSQILDTYSVKFKSSKILLSLRKVDEILGEDIPEQKAESILKKLGFKVTKQGKDLLVEVPSSRRNDVLIQEDLIEEIARVYGYQNLKSALPPQNQNQKYIEYDDEFYWEEKVKNAMKYWGFIETYTYSLIPENLYQGPINDGIKLKNPLSEDMLFLRNSIVPGLIKIAQENKTRDKLRIFELSNTYHKRPGKLPIERLRLAALLREENLSFLEAKGVVEALLRDLGIEKVIFKSRENPSAGAEIYIKGDYVGYIEILSVDLINFELDFNKLLTYATLNRKFKGLAKFPPIVEDLSVVTEKEVSVETLISSIKDQSNLIKDVSLLDEFENKKTFHIVYQSLDKNLTTSDISPIRNRVIKYLTDRFGANIK